MTSHRIALVPGFLGFDHSGELTYFADRFIAGLRASVEARVGRPVPVTPVAVPPIGSLKERQDALLAALAQLDEPEPCSWHLVGHSTGGLDAALLLRKHKLAYSSDRGSYFSDELLSAPDIKSVTTIAAPHYGTCITRAPITAGTKAGANVEERLAIILAIPELGRDLLQRDALATRLKFGRGAAGRTSVDFLSHLLLGDKLLRDLDPTVAGVLTATQNVELTSVPVFSIATMAPVPTPENTKDQLFALLWKWTQLKAQAAQPRPPQLAEPAARIAADPAQLPARGADIDPTASDGVVNTDRQIYGSFAGLVAADHCDVLGRYYRTDPFDHGVLDPGLITSGAAFGDDQFFELLTLTSRGIVNAML